MLQLEGGVGNTLVLEVGGPAFVVWVTSKGLVELLQQGLLSCLSWPNTLLVQLFEHSVGILVNELADDSVVEVFNWGPQNTLSLVLLLLGLQSKLDKDLLQLLVAIINAKLLKTVGLLKRVNERRKKGDGFQSSARGKEAL